MTAILRTLLLAAAMLLPNVLSASEAVSPADAAAIERTIRGQLDAFGKDDAAGAYRFAAPNVHDAFPTADVFMDMVRRGYAPVYRPRGIMFGALTAPDGLVTQEVDLVGPDGRAVTATYTMERGPDGWVITGCSLQPSVRAST